MQRATAQKGRRQQPRSLETRAAILAAAEEVFAKAGLDGARIDAIATAAGVNKALLYYYFQSKGGLYEAVMDDHFREFNRQALGVLEAPGPAGVVLLRYVSLYFDFISTRHRYASLYQQLMTARGPSLERLVRKYLVPRNTAFKKLLARGVRAGEFRPPTPATRRCRSSASSSSTSRPLRCCRCSATPTPTPPPASARRKREVLEFIRHGLFLDRGAASS